MREDMSFFRSLNGVCRACCKDRSGCAVFLASVLAFPQQSGGLPSRWILPA